MSQVHRSAASGVRIFGEVQPRVCLNRRKVCSTSKRRRYACQRRSASAGVASVPDHHSQTGFGVRWAGGRCPGGRCPGGSPSPRRWGGCRRRLPRKSGGSAWDAAGPRIGPWRCRRGVFRCLGCPRWRAARRRTRRRAGAVGPECAGGGVGRPCAGRGRIASWPAPGPAGPSGGSRGEVRRIRRPRRSGRPGAIRHCPAAISRCSRSRSCRAVTVAVSSPGARRCASRVRSRNCGPARVRR